MKRKITANLYHYETYPYPYRLLVVVFTDTGVQSYEHPFEVVE